MSCSVAGCRHVSVAPNTPGLHFHAFPNSKSNPKLFCAWFRFCENQYIKMNRANYICSDHFLETDYVEEDMITKNENPGMIFYPRLKPGALPSVRFRKENVPSPPPPEIVVKVEPEVVSQREPEDTDTEPEYAAMNCRVEAGQNDTDEDEDEAELPLATRNVSTTSKRNFVDELLVKPFSARPLSEQKEIIKMQVPKPIMLQFAIQEGMDKWKAFKSTWYTSQQWLTGSELNNALYCWTCLLFPKSSINNGWYESGVVTLRNVNRRVTKHITSLAHVYSQVEFSTFGKAALTTPLSRVAADDVKANCDMLKRVIDLVVVLSRQKLQFNEAPGGLPALFKAHCQFDAAIRGFLQSSGLLSKPCLLLDVMKAITTIVTSHIDKELKQTPLFSINIHNVFYHTGRIAITTRFVTSSGHVVERFIGFFDNPHKSAEDIEVILRQTFNDYSDNVVAYSIDGGVVTSGEMDTLRSHCKALFPHAILLHHYSHRLDLVITQTCFEIQSVKMFFASFYCLIKFMTVNKELLDVKELDDIDKWSLSKSVSFVISYRVSVLDLFNNLLNNTGFSSQMLHNLQSFVLLLNSFEFVFFLYLFQCIFEPTIPFDVLYNSPFDVDIINQHLTCYVDNLKDINSDANFESIYNKTKVMTEEKADLREVYEAIFASVFNLIIPSLAVRLEDHLKINFMKLADVKHMQLCNDRYRHNLPYALSSNEMNTLNNVFGHVCGVGQLDAELKAVYCNIKLWAKLNHTEELLHSVVELGIRGTLEKFTEFLTLVLALPIAPLFSVQVPVFSRIRQFSDVHKELLPFLAVLEIEHELVQTLESQCDWYQKIINILNKEFDDKQREMFRT